MRFSRLILVCMVCKQLLGTSVETPAGQTGITHGLCEPCLQQQFATIDERA